MTDEENKVSMVRYVLVGAAFFTVIGILAVTVWRQVEDEYIQGILTLVLGRMLGYVDSVYNFEFGNTRGNNNKDDTIIQMTKTAVTTAATAQAAQSAQVAADAAAASKTPASALKASEVKIDAETVTVDSNPINKDNP